MHAPHVITHGGSPSSGTAHAPAKPAPAPPRPATPNKPGAKPDEGGGLRILTYLRLHWLMILFCGTLLGGAGAYGAWELLASKFESHALMQVSSVPAALASGNREQARTDFVTYLKTTSALIKSEFVLNAALRDIKDLPTIKAQKDPIKFLDEELMVNWQDGSEVLRITFKGAEPQDAKKIVDAVQNAFMKEVIETEVKEKQGFLKKVEDAQTEMTRTLERKFLKPDVKLAGGPSPPGPAAPVVPAAPAAPADAANPLTPLPPLAPGAPAPAPLPAVPGMASS